MVKVMSLSHIRLFATPWTVTYQAPCPWDFPGKSTGVGCHFLLQGTFPTQGSNPALPHCRQMLYHLSHQERRWLSRGKTKSNRCSFLSWSLQSSNLKSLPTVWLRRWSICLHCGRPRFEPWVGKILWRRKWQPTPVLLPGKSHGQRSPVGYSPWGHKESETTERLHFTWLQSQKQMCTFAS